MAWGDVPMSQVLVKDANGFFLAAPFPGGVPDPHHVSHSWGGPRLLGVSHMNTAYAYIRHMYIYIDTYMYLINS